VNLSSVEEISRIIKDFIQRLSSILNTRLGRVLDAYFLIKDVEIIDVKVENDEVVGIRIKIPSEHRRDTYHYVTVGLYGFKCTCEACTIRKMVCKHVIVALSVWHLIMIVKYGKELNLEKIKWLRRDGNFKEVERSL